MVIYRLLWESEPENSKFILCVSEQLSREKEAQAMGVGLKYSHNNRLWLTVYTRSFVSCPILSAFKGGHYSLDWTTGLDYWTDL